MTENAGWLDISTCEVTLSSNLKFAVAIDGSVCSNVVLDYLARGMLWKNRNSSLDVIHVYDSSKTYLPPNLRSDAVREHVESMLASSLSATRYKLRWIAKSKDRAASHIAEQANADGADFVCLGFMGLKGKKDTKMISSNVHEVLRQSKCSVMVIKDESIDLLPMERPAVFLVSVSLNGASIRVFFDALRLSQPNDELHVAYCVGFLENDANIYTDKLRTQYEGFFSSLPDGSSEGFASILGRRCSFHIISQQKSESVPQAIVRHADEIKADFIVVFTKTLHLERGRERLGSVSMHICMETDRNVVVSHCKE